MPTYRDKEIDFKIAEKYYCWKQNKSSWKNQYLSSQEGEGGGLCRSVPAPHQTGRSSNLNVSGSSCDLPVQGLRVIWNFSSTQKSRLLPPTWERLDCRHCISGGKKSTSGRRPVIMAALPRIKWRDILCTSWLTTSLSLDPVCLASAAPRRLSWLMAWWCMPPRVSRAIGRKTSPCCLQASAVSRIFLSYAWSRAPPGRAVAAARLELARGLVTVTSRAASFPSLHLRMKTSPGLAADPGSRCRSDVATWQTWWNYVPEDWDPRLILGKEILLHDYRYRNITYCKL